MSVVAILCLALTAGAASEDASLPPPVRAEAERFLLDWKNGRLSEAHERFSSRLRQLVTVTQLEASLEPVRTAIGQYVALSGERLSDDRIDDQRAVILEATLRFERATTTGKFAFLAERGAWRLRHVKVDLPLAQRPPLDDAPVAKIAREILDGLARDGLVSVVRLLPQQAREQFGEQVLREVFERMAETMGARVRRLEDSDLDVVLLDQ